MLPAAGEEGAAALAGALRQNSSIKELHIKGNELGDKGAGELCEALLVRSAELQVRPGGLRAGGCGGRAAACWLGWASSSAVGALVHPIWAGFGASHSIWHAMRHGDSWRLRLMKPGVMRQCPAAS